MAVVNMHTATAKLDHALTQAAQAGQIKLSVAIAAAGALVSVQWQLYDTEQAVEPGCRMRSCKLNLKGVAIFLVAGHARKQGVVAIFSSQKRLKISRKL